MKLIPTGVLKALAMEFKMLFTRKDIVLQYPKERYEIPERGRYGVEMDFNEDGSHKCTGCKLCQNACPYECINIEVSAGEGGRHIDHWYYQQSACVVCGYCVEACTFNAIVMSHDYERAHFDPALKTIQLLTDTPVAKPKRPEGAPARPAPKPAPAATPGDTSASPRPTTPTADAVSAAGPAEGAAVSPVGVAAATETGEVVADMAVENDVPLGEAAAVACGIAVDATPADDPAAANEACMTAVEVVEEAYEDQGGERRGTDNA